MHSSGILIRSFICSYNKFFSKIFIIHYAHTHTSIYLVTYILYTHTHTHTHTHTPLYTSEYTVIGTSHIAVKKQSSCTHGVNFSDCIKLVVFLTAVSFFIPKNSTCFFSIPNTTSCNYSLISHRKDDY